MTHNNFNLPPKAVLFDMDGLMFDTERLSIPIWEKAGKSFGYNILPEHLTRTIGVSGKKTREIMLEIFGDDFPYEKIRDEIRRLFREEFEKNGIPKKTGLDELLFKLREAGIPMGVSTSTQKQTALSMLERAGIINNFMHITGGDEVANGKPAPDIFLITAEKLGVSPSDCVGLEDSAAGLKALHAAGIRSIFIKDLIEPPQEILDTVWRKCKNLLDAISTLGV